MANEQQRLGLSSEDRLKVRGHILKKMNLCYPTASASILQQDAVAMETHEYSKATSFEGYLRSIGSQLDVMERQAAERNESARNEAARNTANPDQSIQVGAFRPGPSSYPLSQQLSQQHQHLMDQQNPATHQQEVLPMVESRRSQGVLASHAGVRSDAHFRPGSVPMRKETGRGRGGGRGGGRGRGGWRGRGRGRARGRGRGKLQSTPQRAGPSTVPVQRPAPNTTSTQKDGDVPSKMPRYGWLQRVPIPFFDTLTMGEEFSSCAPRHASSQTDTANEAVWANLEQLQKRFRGKFRQISLMSQFIVNAQPARFQGQIGRHIKDCLEILDVERRDDTPPFFTVRLLRRAERFIKNVIEVFPHICASLENLGRKPTQAPQPTQRPAKPAHNAQKRVQITAKPVQLASTRGPSSALRPAPIPPQLLSAPQMRHMHQDDSAQAGPGIALDITSPANSLALQHSRDPRRRELGKRPNQVQRHSRDPRKRARPLHDAPRSAQVGIPAKSGRPASGVGSHNLLGTASVVPVQEQHLVHAQEPRRMLQAHVEHDNPDIPTHDVLQTQQLQEEIQPSLLRQPQQHRQTAHNIPALQGRPGTDAEPARGHWSAAHPVSPAVRLPPPDIMTKNVQYVQTRAEIALQDAEELEEVFREEMRREQEERIEDTHAVLRNARPASSGVKRDVSRDQGGYVAKRQRKEFTKRQSLKQVVEAECRCAQEGNPLLQTEISEEFGFPVVACQLLVEEIRLPKLFIRVQHGYPVKGGTTFGFERPPLGWVGVLGEIRGKFKASLASAPATSFGIAAILDAWGNEAEEVINTNLRGHLNDS